MFKESKRVLLLLLLSLLIPSITHADTIRGKFKFNKKAPFVGLVYFADDTSGLRLKKGRLVIDQIDKKFTKKIVVGSTGSTIIFKNSDPIDHNIYSRDADAGVDFDAGVVVPGDSSKLAMDWESGKIIRIGCKIHPKMRAYIANISSSFYKIINFKKKKTTFNFKLNDVPADLTRIRVWLPHFDLLELDLQKGDSKNSVLTKKNKEYGKLSIIRE